VFLDHWEVAFTKQQLSWEAAFRPQDRSEKQRHNPSLFSAFQRTDFHSTLHNHPKVHLRLWGKSREHGKFEGANSIHHYL
jgi:hypothetical protein